MHQQEPSEVFVENFAKHFPTQFELLKTISDKNTWFPWREETLFLQTISEQFQDPYYATQVSNMVSLRDELDEFFTQDRCNNSPEFFEHWIATLRPSVETVIKTIESIPPTSITVFGESDSGKSTLINALLKTTVVPIRRFVYCY